MDMKIKTSKDTDYKIYPQALPVSLIAELDRLAKRASLSRTKLVEAILKQALNDPKFILEV